MPRLTNRRALITGASRGIGKAIALQFAKEGAMVAVHYHQSLEQAKKVLQSLEAEGAKGCLVQGDIRQLTQAERVVIQAEKGLGGLDILVNNAGVEYEETIEQTLEAHWDETFALNVKGAFFCCRAAAKAMQPCDDEKNTALKTKTTAAIVNISSRFGFLGDPNSIAYGASKAALNNLTKALAKHYAPHIRVNGVAPAYTPTDMMAHASEEYRQAFYAATPLQRITQPQDTAAAAVFLASHEASFTTGATLLVDGGYSLK